MPEFANKHRVLERIRKRIRLGENDDFFIVFGPEGDCRTAADEIRLRFCDATVGVPKETRQALPGGFTTFERILPGPDRMYPDTDSPPTRVTQERVAEARSRLRPAPWERIERYLSWRVPEETAHYLIRRGGAEIVDAAVERTGVDGLFAAITLGQRVKALKRAGIPVQRLDMDAWLAIFDRFTDGRLPREVLPAVARRMAQEGLGVDEACLSLGIAPQSRDQWLGLVDHMTLEGYDGTRADCDEKRVRFLAGKAVRMLKGRAPAGEVAAFVRTKLASEVVK
jgi:glutamyl-tRNA(Gln) amidotransferase subunit E